jgi:hypothetical protein
MREGGKIFRPLPPTLKTNDFEWNDRFHLSKKLLAMKHMRSHQLNESLATTLTLGQPGLAPG